MSKNTLIVTFVGMSGGFIDYPCYKDQDGHYYFDINQGRGDLNLCTGAYWNENCGEICGEPNEPVEKPVICEEPFRRSPYELTYMRLGRLQADCEYFLGYGRGYERQLYGKSVEATCDLMQELYDSLPDTDKPEWLTKEDIACYRTKMLEGRIEK